MKKYLTNTVWFLILVVFGLSCDNERNPYPIGNCTVSFVIQLDGWHSDFAPGRMKTFNRANSAGHTGCYDGIVVLNLDNENFLAYDMACPNDHFYGCMVIDFHPGHREFPTDSLRPDLPPHFRCSCCNTRFNILDGRPMRGADTRYPMKSYKITIQQRSLTGNPVRILVHN